MPLLVDLFSGAGGSALGFVQAGFRIAAAVDIDRWAVETYRRNLGSAFQGDLRFLTGEDLLSAAGLTEGEVDTVLGCPPCQGFTDHGRRGDPRNSLVKTFLERIYEIRPRSVVFENVPGIIRRGRHLLDLLSDRLRRIGYRVSWDVLNAADYGVPQVRRRVVLIAVRREDGAPSMPAPTHAHPEVAPKLGLEPWRTVRDAFRNLPPPGTGLPNHEPPRHSPRIRELISMIPKNGGSIRDLPKKYWLRCHLNHNGHRDVYGRLEWNRPATTITCGVYSPSKGRFIHPEEDRGITMREAARLQGFPDWFTFEGPRRAVACQIGNALPPPMARRIAKSLIRSLTM